jgi:hypothetical protein
LLMTLAIQLYRPQNLYRARIIPTAMVLLHCWLLLSTMIM